MSLYQMPTENCSLKLNYITLRTESKFIEIAKNDRTFRQDSKSSSKRK